MRVQQPLVRCSFRPHARVPIFSSRSRGILRTFTHSLGFKFLPKLRAPTAGASTPRWLSSGARTVPDDEPFEEEKLPGYQPENFYPAKLGEELNSRYRVVVKLGFGVGSTVWLCRDLKTNWHVTVKICTLRHGNGHPAQAESEKAVSAFFKSVQVEHPGIQALRLLVDDFTIDGPRGTHQCLVYPPLGMTLTEFRNRLPTRIFPKLLLQHSLLCISFGLDLLHQAGIVHTDLSPNNVLLGVQDSSVFSQLEREEIDHPMERKALPGRTIYGSSLMPVTTGMPVICDFGSFFIGEPGQKRRGDVMPDFYRAPEVILGMEWDEKIDIWCVRLMLWDLFQGNRLFYALKDRILDDEQHLAEMVALMGPPPKAFLKRSDKCRQYWDSEGNWIAQTPIPEQSFISCERHLQGEDQRLFIALARKIFRWLPEERPTAQDLTEDEFIAQPQLQRQAKP